MVRPNRLLAVLAALWLAAGACLSGAEERPREWFPKSAEEIRKELARIGQLPIRLSDREVLPPKDRAARNLTEEELIAEGFRELLRYRYLCDVPYRDLETDAGYTHLAQAAAELLNEQNLISHDPRNCGWPAERYEKARKGAGSCNLYHHTQRATVVDAIRLFMNDSDAGNITKLGHRRWCLNPEMKRLGFGLKGHVATLYCMDRSRNDAPQWDFVAYPPRGLMPLEYFEPTHAWCVLLNPERFEEPPGRKPQVMVRPCELSGGKPVPGAALLELDNACINLQNYGVRYALIFRPAELRLAPGVRFQVDIKGLRKKDDVPMALTYVVEFFKL